jgi:hypothetical protein
MFLGFLPLIVGVLAIAYLGTSRIARAARAAAHGGSPMPAGAFSPDPTSEEVTPDDVIGRWQLYLDDVSKTVTIDFHADGTFAETILDNREGSTECLGGTWTLSGPNVALSGYVAASRGTAESITWWMVETASGPALYGGDDPDSFFAMQKRRQEPFLGDSLRGRA